MKEAVLYRKLEDKKVKCTACMQGCTIQPDYTGICGVRQNVDGKLYLLVYGKASAVNIDPIEKKPLFHFLPGSQIFSIGTVGCNFGCDFCQNWDLSQCTKDLKEKLLKENKIKDMGVKVCDYGYELLPERIIEICRQKGIPSVAYTYNEPTIFLEYAYDTAKLANKEGMKNVFVSNGFETEEALKKIKPYLDGINIDLKSFSDEFYRKTCKARLQPVLDTIKLAHKLGIWVEVTTLVIPTMNDSDEELKSIAKFIKSVDPNIPWHVTAFHPDYKMTDKQSTKHSSLEKAHRIGMETGLNYVYVGNVIDDVHSSTYCPNCKALLVKRSGHYISIESFKDGKCTKCGEKIPGVWK
ncbi:AmmeMemoRadiSam system radical SAM enzyme [Candidatus Woesearchaeota archaeon]|nr:AmmeMemoRadiSam system radical SAM enzyme [Candidatus Woesearchaeota archaeon]